MKPYESHKVFEPAAASDWVDQCNDVNLGARQRYPPKGIVPSPFDLDTMQASVRVKRTGTKSPVASKVG
jgi:hypothetical protein